MQERFSVKAGIQGLTAKEGTVEKTFYVYILASRRNGTLYIGVTSNLVQRVWQHKTKVIAGFTAKYGIERLVYFEQHHTAEGALQRERQLKKWNRAWKLRLIKNFNPQWLDLYSAIS